MPSKDKAHATMTKLVDLMTLLTKGEYLQFHNLYEFINGKGAPCNGKCRLVCSEIQQTYKLNHR